MVVPGEVGRDPVHDDADAQLVGPVHEELEVVRRAVAAGGGEVARDLIAPAGVVGVREQRHDLDVGVAHVLHVGQELVRELPVGKALLPAAQMALVDVHGAREGVLQARQIPFVGPGIGIRVVDQGAGAPVFGHAGIGVRLQNDGTVGAGHYIFILLIGLGVLDDGLPQPVGPTPGGVLGVAPAVEVPGHGDEPGVGRPDDETEAPLRPMAAQKLIGADASALIKIGDLIGHMSPQYIVAPSVHL